ncbi:MAG TPA: HAD hydrolase-like protein [Terriglobales bacterium]|nr:HAD hydrolase-like protein [Terriglobales bacterium]
MTAKAYPDPKPFREKARLVILDLDCFLYPYNKTYRKAVLRAWWEVQREYGLPILRRKTAQTLIEEAKEEANKNPDDALCRYISKLAGSLESKGLPAASAIGMLEVYYRNRKAARSVEGQDIRPDQALDPAYKDMIAMAFNLRLLQNRKSGKKAGLRRDELQGRILDGGRGATRLWHRHMGTAFIHADAGLGSKIQRLTNAGVEVAVLTHSFKQGEGEAMEKLKKLGLGGLISEHNVFGLEEIAPYKKGPTPEVFEKVLAAINNLRDPADPIKPIETIMAEDTIGNLRGAKKAGMQTVWVPRRAKDMKLQKKLAFVDHIYATPHEFLDALDAAIRASAEALVRAAVPRGRE